MGGIYWPDLVTISELDNSQLICHTSSLQLTPSVKYGLVTRHRTATYGDPENKGIRAQIQCQPIPRLLGEGKGSAPKQTSQDFTGKGSVKEIELGSLSLEIVDSHIVPMG